MKYEGNDGEICFVKQIIDRASGDVKKLYDLHGRCTPCGGENRACPSYRGVPLHEMTGHSIR